MERRFGKGSKKGSIQDLILIGSILVAFGIIVLISFKVVTEFETQLGTMSDIPAEATDSLAKIKSFYPGIIDKSFLLLMVGLTIGTLILAALVRIHPIFIPLAILAWVFIIFISGIMSNIYQEIASQTQLIALANQLTFITSILTYLPIIIGVIGGLLMIVQYKQWSNA